MLSRYGSSVVCSSDLTIAPTAALGSLVFAPEVVIPAALEMHERYGDFLYSSYGFLDAFNPSFQYDIPLKTGRLVPDKGWVASDYIGIDQGPILAMIRSEEHTSELQSLMRISYAVFCLKQKKNNHNTHTKYTRTNNNT